MITLLALAAALAASSPGCTKLSADFEANEKSMATLHEIGMIVANSSLSSYEALGDRKYFTAYQQAFRDVQQTDQGYEAKGNAITQLMIGHKCKLPDHITGSKNPTPQNQSRSAAAQ